MALFRNAPWLLFFPKQHVVSITKPAFYFSKKSFSCLAYPSTPLRVTAFCCCAKANVDFKRQPTKKLKDMSHWSLAVP